MNTTLTHVNPSIGRLGKADSPELCKSIIDEIPLERLLAAKKVLDVACGYGGFAKAYVNRVEPYIGREEAFNRIWLLDSYRGCTNFCKQRLGFKNTVHSDFLTWQPNMQFDVIIGNPPYNNKGKTKGQKNTSGTSLWVQFLKKMPELMKDGGWCTLLVPSAVGNTNSLGWRAIKSTSIESIKTGLSEQYFKVNTAISQVTFTKAKPNPVMEINGRAVDRTQMVVAPLHPNPLAVGVMYKLQNTGSKMAWRRTNFPTFVGIAKESPNTVGMPALDRGNYLRPRSLEALTSGKDLSKCEMLSIEVDDSEAFIEILKHPLLKFFHAQSGSTGNLTLGSIREITLPDGWQTNNLYKAYGLTAEETKFIQEWAQ